MADREKIKTPPEFIIKLLEINQRRAEEATIEEDEDAFQGSRLARNPNYSENSLPIPFERMTPQEKLFAYYDEGLPLPSKQDQEREKFFLFKDGRFYGDGRPGLLEANDKLSYAKEIVQGVPVDDRLPRWIVVSPERGSGGMAEVFIAWDTKMGDFVAIKVNKPFNMGTPSISNEAQTQANLLKIAPKTLDVTTIDGQEAFVMEWLGPSKAISLKDLIMEGEKDLKDEGGEVKKRTYTLRDILSIIEQLGITLHWMAQNKSFNPDVKPGNIFYTDDGRVVVADWGMAGDAFVRLYHPGLRNIRARLRGNSMEAANENGTQPLLRARDLHMLSDSSIAGTPSYLAPELLKGKFSGLFGDDKRNFLIDHLDDLPLEIEQTMMFILSSIIIEMLSGQVTFGKYRDPHDIMTHVMSGELSLSDPRFSNMLANLERLGVSTNRLMFLLERALSKKREERGFKDIRKFTEAVLSCFPRHEALLDKKVKDIHRAEVVSV